MALINKIITFILNHISEHPNDIAKVTALKFSISRQAVHRYLQNLVQAKLLEATGQTRSISYRLKPTQLKRMNFPIKNGLLPNGTVPEEDRIWRENFARFFTSFPKNIKEICQYGFSEIFNNAIDHSEGTKITVLITVNAVHTEMMITDNGVGIFTKIKETLELEDERQAILELSKGKLTTDPKRHTGEGIFFTSRMFDHFIISSGHLLFKHFDEGDDWLTQSNKEDQKGTAVLMKIALRSSRTTKEVFDQYAAEEDDFGFTKTIIPVNLLQYGEENLISRSQAKRLLARFERFREILLDFHGVAMIGPAFADEIFRVFSRQNPHIKLCWTHANKEVEKYIQKALQMQ